MGPHVHQEMGKEKHSAKRKQEEMGNIVAAAMKAAAEKASVPSPLRTQRALYRGEKKRNRVEDYIITKSSDRETWSCHHIPEYKNQHDPWEFV